MRALPHTRSCFVCGQSNPIGLKLTLQTDGEIVQTHYTPQPDHVGFKHVVHGGIVSTLLDEVMAWVCAVKGRQFAYCAELSVRFLKPLRPAEPVSARAELVENRRDRIFLTKAEVRSLSGMVLATAKGKYLPVRAAELPSMAGDLVGDPASVFEPGGS